MEDAPMVLQEKGPSAVAHFTVAPHSVEISRNASGGVSVSVKCYAATPGDAAQRAKELFAALDAEYPAAVKVVK